jgi:hypothetical protein
MTPTTPADEALDEQGVTNQPAGEEQRGSGKT